MIGWSVFCCVHYRTTRVSPAAQTKHTSSSYPANWYQNQNWRHWQVSDFFASVCVCVVIALRSRVLTRVVKPCVYCSSDTHHHHITRTPQCIYACYCVRRAAISNGHVPGLICVVTSSSQRLRTQIFVRNKLIILIVLLFLLSSIYHICMYKDTSENKCGPLFVNRRCTKCHRHLIILSLPLTFFILKNLWKKKGNIFAIFFNCLIWNLYIHTTFGLK